MRTSEPLQTGNSQLLEILKSETPLSHPAFGSTGAFFPFPSAARRFGLALVGLVLALAGSASAATYTVTYTADTDVEGTLRWAIAQANANAGADTINFNNNLGTIIYTNQSPLITDAVTINGGVGNSVSGNNAERIFFIDTANASDAVNINNLSLVSGRGKGGDGGLGGGGGGLGGGGAIFVNRGAVTVSNVQFTGNTVQGGAGGDGSTYATNYGAGGGGGLGGNGGVGNWTSAAGGGGYGGNGGNGTDGGTGGGGGLIGNGGSGSSDNGRSTGGGGGGLTNGTNASGKNGGTGGVAGGWGASANPDTYASSGALYGGGGGGGGYYSGFSIYANGGDGGKFGGGGGGGGSVGGGSGGDFGGGGGKFADGPGAGSGGFGGGGGGASFTPSYGGGRSGNGGFGGGAGGASYGNKIGTRGILGGEGGYRESPTLLGGGGGGGAAGGAIFVRSENGATLTFADSGISGGSATAGAAGFTEYTSDTSKYIYAASKAGKAAGTGIFLSGGNATFLISSGVTSTISDTIYDANFDWGDAAGITKTGAGTLVLSGSNGYAGGTTLSAGTLSLGSAGAVGTTGAISFTGGTLQSSAANTTDYSSRFSTAASQQYRIDTNGQNVTLASALTSEGGTLTKSGSGTLTLSSSNTYSGSTFLIDGTLRPGSSSSALGTGGISFSGGTLQFSAANTTDYSSRFANGTNMKFRIDTNGQNVTFASSLNSQDGTLTKLGSGTLTLAAANGYTGATTISVGTLQLAAASASSAFALASGATLDLKVASGSRNSGINTTFSGAGNLTKTGAGTMLWGGGAATFQMASGSLIDVEEGSFVGGSNANEVWINNQSRLNVASGANFYGVEANVRVDALSGSGLITSGYTGSTYQNFTFGVANGSGTFAGVLADHPGFVGNFVKAGTGTQILTGENTYTGTTTISGGTLQIGNGGTTGSLASSGMVNNARIAISRSNDVTYAGAISGTGGLQKLGAGTLSLTGVNTYTGTTTISGGTLQIGDGGVTGSLAGSAIVNSAALVFNRSNASSYSSAISGTGGLTKLGEGVLTLGGTSTYTGTTTISGGTLEIGEGGTSGSLASSVIVNNATLAFNRSDSLVYAGGISGTGGLTNLGAGALTITGANTYTGVTTISAGTLQIGNGGTVGSLASSVIVNNATLAFNRSNDMAYAGSISGTGALLKLGASNLTLSAANTYTGATTVSTGTLRLLNTTTSASFAIASGATLDFNVTTESGTQTANTLFSGAGRLVKSGSGEIRWFGAGTFSMVKGSLIDVQDGLFTGGSGANEVWTSNQSGLNVAGGAHFSAVEANVSVDALTGSGLISSGFNGSNVFTFGVADGSGTFAGVLSNNPVGGGLGNFTKAGTGKQILTGTNTYTGTTAISGGTLQIGNGGTTGSLASDVIVNNATLVFNRSDARSYSGSISGTGGVTKLGGSALTLEGANTYTGVTTITAGTLQIGNGGAIGSLASSVIVNNASVAFSHSNDLAYAGAISGTGALQKLGEGTLSLTAGNTYSGATTVSAGTLQIGDGGTSGSLASSSIVNNAALVFNRSDASFFSGSISGTGDLTKLGAGVLTLGGNNTYRGVTTVSGGTLQFGDGTTGPLGTSGIVNNATVAFSVNNDHAYASIINGTGNLQKDGGGVLTLTGSNTYSGPTKISGGTLQIGDGGTTGSLATSAIVNNSALVFNRSDDISYAVPITGTGTLTKLGANTLTLGGANAYTGQTTISGGTLQIGDGGTSGSIASSAIVNNAALVFNRSDASFFSGLITGSGSLTKLGAGVLTLGGNNTFRGVTNVNSGTLRLTGSVYSEGTTASSIVVNSGGALLFNRQDILGNAAANSPVVITINNGGLVTNTGASAFNTLNNLVMNGGELRADAGGSAIYPAFQLKGTVVIGGTSASKITTTGAANSGIQLGNNTNTGVTTFDVADVTGDSAADLVISANLENGRVKPSTFATSGLTKTGGGTLILTGTNSYTGITTLSGGKLVVDGSLASSAVTISAGALQIGDGTTSGSIAGNIVNNSSLVFHLSASPSSYGGNVSGNGILTKLGSGTLSLTADNSYAGTMNVNEGTLRLQGGAFSFGGNAGAININSGATLLLNRQNIFGSATETPQVVLTINAGGLVTNTGASVFNTFNNLVMNGGELRADAGGDASFPAFQLKGTVVIGGASASQITTTGAANSGIQLGNNTNTGITTFDVADVTGDSAADLVISANLENGRVNPSTFAASGLTKTGTGTLILTGTNSYTNTTTISAGTLVVDGSLSNSSLVAINNGGTLGGGGTVGAVAINDGGLISPGNSPGKLTTGAETWAGGAGYVWELNDASDADDAKGVSYDWLNIDGTLDITATSNNRFTIYVTSLTAFDTPGLTPGFVFNQTYQWVLATASAGITNFSADNFAIDTSAFFNDTANLGSFEIVLSEDLKSLNLTYTNVVPEPSTTALVLGTLLGALLLLRRRRQRA